MRLPTLCTAAVAAFALTAAAAAPAEPGAIDFGRFSPAAGRQYVEINVGGGLLALAARLAEKQEPQAAALLRELKQVRVVVLGLDDSNQAPATECVAAVRDQLAAAGWSPVVTVREPEGDNVDVHLKLGANDSIEGLVVTVLSRQREAVFVNVVGSIRPERLAELAERFNVEPLRRVPVTGS